MADNIQEAILTAVDYLVSNRIDKIDRDKTIVATIVSCSNALTQEYKVSYNNGFLTAYAQEDASYNPNQEVYVLVPSGDFSKKKMIIGVASQLAGDDNVTFVSSLMNDYNMIGRNVISDPNNITPASLHSYLKEEYILLYDRDAEDDSNFLRIDEDEFNNYIKSAEALLVEASFQTRLPRAHRVNKQGVYGLQFVLAFSNKDQPDQINYYSYVLDTNSMTGNPLLYNTYTEQYAIFPIDTENFLYVDSILFYEEDFVEESDTIQADLWGPDIFVKDLEIYCLREISATNGDYVLRIGTPEGATFQTINSNEILPVVAKTTYKVNTDISDSTTFYWFAKDDRVDSSSEHYQMYGGSGWRYLRDKGNNYQIELSGSENRAYENVYLLTAVYKESVVLKEEFTMYNEASEREITITSDLGLKFAFDRGKPVLTCLVNGKSQDFEEGKEDEWFSFSWSKLDEYGNVTPINKTYEQLQEEYDEGFANQIGYSALAAIKNQMLAMEGVEFDRNVLKYPIKQIDARAIFSCSVYMRERADAEDYFIGSATITLQNETSAQPSDYYILIENGDQVFQYSESGVSPASDRYTDPLEVLPLECHFYDPAGLEVNNVTYSVQWKVPLTDSLLVVPAEGMVINPATDLLEIYTERIFPTAIKDSYDYQALNNQITCIVTYNGQEWSYETDFLFTKVGENGTNGTDVVCKISPVNPPDDSLLAINLVNGADPVWNTGAGIGTDALEFEAYNRSELLNLTSVSWTMSGGNAHARNMSVEAGSTYDQAIISWGNLDGDNLNQIVRGYTSFEGQAYYAFYPVPVINYHSATGYGIKLDKTKTLKSITYNADGRNPLYNKNQGIFFTITSNSPKYAVYEAIGGAEDNSNTAALNVHLEKDTRDIAKSVGSYPGTDGVYCCYITPDDVYDGAYCNNMIKVSLYTSDVTASTGGNPEAEIYIPIYMSLNTFGLASLNAWDGNHVEINEDENYILAPQIGAGIKDDNNRFTGVVMGKAQTYDQKDVSVGLLGYSEGKQSIWLDSQTGKAVFGLPEDQASANNQYTEGRIELVPGGESKIGMWRIGSRALYNMTVPDEEEDVYIGVEPDRAYRDYRVKGAQMSVPPTAQGLILNANPAYISVKGKPLTSENSQIDWDGANTVIKEGDSLEIELDPSKDSAFSIYRHTTYEGSVNTGDWRRYPVVGINSNGQFYTNAVENGESQMGIGYIGAFGKSAADQAFVGGQFAYDSNNIFKFFIDYSTASSSSGQVYISAGTTTRNEYQRPISIHGSTIALYGEDTTSTAKITDHKITIDNRLIYMGHPDNYIQIPSTSGRSNGFKVATDAIVTIDFNGSSSTINNKNTLTLNSKRLVETLNAGTDTAIALQQTIKGSISTTGFYNLTMQSNDAYGTSFRIGAGTSRQARMGGSNSYVETNQTTMSNLVSRNGWNIQDTNGGIYINSTGPEINMSANGVEIVMTSGTSGDFHIRSTHGQVYSTSNMGNNRQGVVITPALSSGQGFFTGNLECGGNIECSGTIRADVNVGCTDLWCKGVFANTLQLGGKMIDEAWLNSVQNAHDQYWNHKHTFSVTGTAAAQSVSYSGTAVVPNGTRVGTYTLASGNSGVIYAGSNASGDISIVFGDSGISVPYSGTVTAAAQTVTLSGTSSGPTTTATNSSGPIQ